jgi:hypothetical protein
MELPEGCKKVELTLVGLDGNAFALMGAFSNAAKRQGWNAAAVKAVCNECMSGDYNALLRTLMSVCDEGEEVDDDDEEGDDEHWDEGEEY